MESLKAGKSGALGLKETGLDSSAVLSVHSRASGS